MFDKELLRLLGKNKKYVLYTVAVMLLGTLANIGITACICAALHLLTQGAKASECIIIGVVAAIALIVRYCSNRISSRIKEKLGSVVKKDLRAKTYNKILKLGSSEAGEISTAGLTQVSIEGIEQLDLYYSVYLPQFFYAMLAPFLLFGICIFIDVRVSLVLLACVPLIPVAIIAVSKYAKRIFAKYWGKYTSMGDVFLDSISGMKELKIYKADEIRHKKINESAEEFRKITMKVLVMQLASITIMDLVAFGGAGVGIAFAVMGASGGGNAIAALFLVLVAVEFFLPLRSLGSAFHVAMNGASAGRKIITLLNLPEPKWGTNAPNGQEIQLTDVTFSYDGQRQVLKNISAFFPKGMTAIVGESGSGKSTIVNLIAGTITPNNGTVTIGKMRVDQLARDKYYSNIAIVSYNTYIFNQTVRENFYLSQPTATDEEIFEALKKVNLDTFIIQQSFYSL